MAHAGANAVSEGDIASVAQKCAGGDTAFDVDEGVSTGEDGHGRERVESGSGAIEAGAAAAHDLFRGMVEALARLPEAMAPTQEAGGWILLAEANGKGFEALCLRAQTAGGGLFETSAEVVDALLTPGDGIVDASEDVCGGEPGEALTGLQEMEATGAVDGAAEVFQSLFDAVLGGGDDFGGGGGGGSAEV